jgi:hypothetical protein
MAAEARNSPKVAMQQVRNMVCSLESGGTPMLLDNDVTGVNRVVMRGSAEPSNK